MKNKKSIILLGCSCSLGLLLLFFGCKATGGSSGSLKAEAAFFDALRDRSFRYQTLSARIQFHIVTASGKELSSRGQLKVEKDYRLQISIQPVFGIEMFRIELTPDSIRFVDRMNKKYFVEDYTALKERSNIAFNFYNLQALFTNRLFLPGETALPADAFTRFQWKQTPEGYVLHAGDRTGLHYLFSANREEKLYAATITDQKDYTLQWNYTGFRAVGRQYFPLKMNGMLYAKNAQHAITLNYSQVETDTSPNMQFTIPSGYERLTLSQLAKLFDQ
ncbi:MAG: DUF4292 domain-containing protein [Tannerella sp.]|jgi:hypothetical protein|nr:DUF4292 domain-containing protein [Tannerella sp.]